MENLNSEVLNQIKGMKIVIRPYSAQDHDKTMVVLKDGSYSNITPSFNLSLQGQTFRYCTVIVCVLAYMLTRSFVIFILTLFLVVGLLYLTQVIGTLYYIYGPPLRDMRNVEKEYFSNTNNHFWVAEVEYENCKQIVGTIAVVQKQKTKSSEKIAWLRRMVVHRAFRGMGIGKKLVHTVIKFCRSKHYDKIELITTEVHRIARYLYESVGFKCEHTKLYGYLHGVINIKTSLYVYSLN